MTIVYTSPHNTYVVTYSTLRGYEVRYISGDSNWPQDWRVIVRASNEPAASKAADELDAAEEAGDFDAIA